MTDELTPVRCGCGGEAHHDSVSCWNPEQEEGMFWHRVVCKNCRTQTKFYYTEAEAIQVWNRAMGSTEKSSTVERTAKVEEVEKPNVFKCSECGQYFHSTAWGSSVTYCSRCGARLEWE